MQNTTNLRNAILLSISTGIFTTIACGDKKEESNTTNTNTESSTETSTGTSTGTNTENTLSPIPDGDYPECSGDTSLSMGQCCVDVYCIAPTDGENCLVPSAETAWDDATTITGLGLGSGDCLCENPEGPYSNEGAQQYTDTTGACCYLVGVASCEGRPLLVAGEIRKAPLLRGRAWRA